MLHRKKDCRLQTKRWNQNKKKKKAHPVCLWIGVGLVLVFATFLLWVKNVRITFPNGLCSFLTTPNPNRITFLTTIDTFARSARMKPCKNDEFYICVFYRTWCDCCCNGYAMRPTSISRATQRGVDFENLLEYLLFSCRWARCMRLPFLPFQCGKPSNGCLCDRCKPRLRNRT